LLLSSSKLRHLPLAARWANSRVTEPAGKVVLGVEVPATVVVRIVVVMTMVVFDWAGLSAASPGEVPD